MMKFLSGVLSIKKLFVNIHFWAITLILGALLFFNYSYLFSLYEQPFNIRLISLYAYSSDWFRALFLVPVLYAGYIFRIPGAIAVSSIVAAILLARPLTEMFHFGIEKNVLFAVALFLACLFVALEENHRQREKSTSKELENYRQVFLSHLLKVQEKERQRIALDLHDDAVQTSLGLANMAESLLTSDHNNLSAEEKYKIEQIKDVAMGMCLRLKKLSRDLRPSMLDHLGLLPAVQNTVNEFNKSQSAEAILAVKGIEYRLPIEDEVNIFRIIQEALANIKRHSEATKVWISISYKPGGLNILIQDNGQGFEIPERIEFLAARGKLGVLGMYERARLAGASFHITSTPYEGTEITLEYIDRQSPEKLSNSPEIVSKQKPEWFPQIQPPV